MTAGRPSILVIEDDAEIRRVLKVGLGHKDYRYLEALTAREGTTEVSTRNPDLIVLDLGLPDLDGLQFLKELRKWSKIPVIVLTARGKEKDKIKALDSGADDYLTKPFGMGELLARIRAALRRSAERHGGDAEPVFESGDLKIDFVRRQVFVKGAEVRLSPMEYRLLTYLARHAGQVLTQKQILKDVWGAAYVEKNLYLRVHMHQLRHKLEADPAQPRWLVTESGVGYRLRSE
ncbi:MAG TPA: response regulator [bacterium]|nr:response regulator [bacterium]